jgi:hypothetical protein
MARVVTEKAANAQPNKSIAVVFLGAVAFFVVAWMVPGHPTPAPTPAETAAIARNAAAMDYNAHLSYSVQNTQARQRADEAALAEAQDLVKQRLRDPDSAEFSGQSRFRYANGEITAVCGEVNAKNGFGGYTGYQYYTVLMAGPFAGQVIISSDPYFSTGCDARKAAM